MKAKQGMNTVVQLLLHFFDSQRRHHDRMPLVTVNFMKFSCRENFIEIFVIEIFTLKFFKGFTV